MQLERALSVLAAVTCTSNADVAALPGNATPSALRAQAAQSARAAAEETVRLVCLEASSARLHVPRTLLLLLRLHDDAEAEIRLVAEESLARCVNGIVDVTARERVHLELYKCVRSQRNRARSAALRCLAQVVGRVRHSKLQAYAVSLLPPLVEMLQQHPPHPEPVAAAQAVSSLAPDLVPHLAAQDASQLADALTRLLRSCQDDAVQRATAASLVAVLVSRPTALANQVVLPGLLPACVCCTPAQLDVPACCNDQQGALRPSLLLFTALYTELSSVARKGDLSATFFMSSASVTHSLSLAAAALAARDHNVASLALDMLMAALTCRASHLLLWPALARANPLLIPAVLALAAGRGASPARVAVRVAAVRVAAVLARRIPDTLATYLAAQLTHHTGHEDAAAAGDSQLVDADLCAWALGLFRDPDPALRAAACHLASALGVADARGSLDSDRSAEAPPSPAAALSSGAAGDDPMPGPASALLLHRLRRALSDESSVVRRSACASIAAVAESCLPATSSWHHHWVLHALPAVIALHDDAYWLVRTQVLACISEIDYALLLACAPSVTTRGIDPVGTQHAALHCIYHLLGDGDERVRDAAAAALADVVPRLELTPLRQRSRVRAAVHSVVRRATDTQATATSPHAVPFIDATLSHVIPRLVQMLHRSDRNGKAAAGARAALHALALRYTLPPLRTDDALRETAADFDTAENLLGVFVPEILPILLQSAAFHQLSISQHSQVLDLLALLLRAAPRSIVHGSVPLLQRHILLVLSMIDDVTEQRASPSCLRNASASSDAAVPSASSTAAGSAPSVTAGVDAAGTATDAGTGEAAAATRGALLGVRLHPGDSSYLDLFAVLKTAHQGSQTQLQVPCALAGMRRNALRALFALLRVTARNAVPLAPALLQVLSCHFAHDAAFVLMCTQQLFASCFSGDSRRPLLPPLRPSSAPVFRGRTTSPEPAFPPPSPLSPPSHQPQQQPQQQRPTDARSLHTRTGTHSVPCSPFAWSGSDAASSAGGFSLGSPTTLPVRHTATSARFSHGNGASSVTSSSTGAASPDACSGSDNKDKDNDNDHDDNEHDHDDNDHDHDHDHDQDHDQDHDHGGQGEGDSSAVNGLSSDCGSDEQEVPVMPQALARCMHHLGNPGVYEQLYALHHAYPITSETMDDASSGGDTLTLPSTPVALPMDQRALIKLFSPLITGAMHQYRYSSDILLHQSVLHLLCCLINLRVDYARLDRSHSFLHHVLSQLSPGVLPMRHAPALLPYILDFLSLLSLVRRYKPDVVAASAVLSRSLVMVELLPARLLPATLPVLTDLLSERFVESEEEPGTHAVWVRGVAAMRSDLLDAYLRHLTHASSAYAVCSAARMLAASVQLARDRRVAAQISQQVVAAVVAADAAAAPDADSAPAVEQPVFAALSLPPTETCVSLEDDVVDAAVIAARHVMSLLGSCDPSALSDPAATAARAADLLLVSDAASPVRMLAALSVLSLVPPSSVPLLARKHADAVLAACLSLMLAHRFVWLQLLLAAVARFVSSHADAATWLADCDTDLGELSACLSGPLLPSRAAVASGITLAQLLSMLPANTVRSTSWAALAVLPTSEVAAALRAGTALPGLGSAAPSPAAFAAVRTRSASASPALSGSAATVPGRSAASSVSSASLGSAAQAVRTVSAQSGSSEAVPWQTAVLADTAFLTFAHMLARECRDEAASSGSCDVSSNSSRNRRASGVVAAAAIATRAMHRPAFLRRVLARVSESPVHALLTMVVRRDTSSLRLVSSVLCDTACRRDIPSMLSVLQAVALLPPSGDTLRILICDLSILRRSSHPLYLPCLHVVQAHMRVLTALSNASVPAGVRARLCDVYRDNGGSDALLAQTVAMLRQCDDDGDDDDGDDEDEDDVGLRADSPHPVVPEAVPASVETPRDVAVLEYQQRVDLLLDYAPSPRHLAVLLRELSPSHLQQVLSRPLPPSGVARAIAAATSVAVMRTLVRHVMEQLAEPPDSLDALMHLLTAVSCYLHNAQFANTAGAEFSLVIVLQALARAAGSLDAMSPLQHWGAVLSLAEQVHRLQDVDFDATITPIIARAARHLLRRSGDGAMGTCGTDNGTDDSLIPWLTQHALLSRQHVSLAHLLLPGSDTGDCSAALPGVAAVPARTVQTLRLLVLAAVRRNVPLLLAPLLGDEPPGVTIDPMALPPLPAGLQVGAAQRLVASVGWPNHECVQRVWSTLLRLADGSHVRLDTDSDDPLRDRTSAVAMLTVMMRMLLLARPGDPSSMMRHIPRDARGAFFNAELGQRLLAVRGTVEEHLRLGAWHCSSLLQMQLQQQQECSAPFATNLEREYGCADYDAAQVPLSRVGKLHGLPGSAPAADSAGELLATALRLLTDSYGTSGATSLRLALYRMLYTLTDFLSPAQHELLLAEWRRALDPSYSLDDDPVRVHVVRGVCKTAAVLRRDSLSLTSSSLADLLRPILTSARGALAVAAYDGVLCLIEARLDACVKSLLPVLFPRVVAELAQRHSVRHSLRLVALMTELIETYPAPANETNFTRDAVTQAIGLAQMRGTTTVVSRAVYHGLERVLVSFSLSHAQRESISMLASRLPDTGYTQTLVRLGLLLTNLYTGNSGSALRDPRDPSGSSVISLLFRKLRQRWSREADLLATLLPQVLLDFFPAPVVVSLVAAEVLEHRPGASLLLPARVLCLVLSHAPDDATAQWVLTCLQHVIKTCAMQPAVWAMTCVCFCVSACPEHHALFHDLVMNDDYAVPSALAIAAARDFYHNAKLDDAGRAMFLGILAMRPEAVFRRVLASLV